MLRGTSGRLRTAGFGREIVEAVEEYPSDVFTVEVEISGVRDVSEIAAEEVNLG